jgi:hypothetical protein
MVGVPNSGPAWPGGPKADVGPRESLQDEAGQAVSQSKQKVSLSDSEVPLVAETMFLLQVADHLASDHYRDAHVKPAS